MYKKSILVTGASGFIGSNFVIHFVNKYPEYQVINLDKLTYAGDTKNTQEIETHDNYKFIQGDICDRAIVEDIFNTYKITDVIHLAAESHVDNSIEGPETFINTNINGTFTLVDVARKYWMDSPFQYKANFENSRFHHISTDEVYGTLGETGLFTEETAYAPNSPYSASKASSDLIVRSYFHTYGLDIVMTNCSNNYGPKQHEEKLIPTIIRKALAQEPIPIYGDGKNVRDWLYVLDHCKAIDLVFHQGKPGETYNVGGVSEKNNLEIVHYICTELDKKRPLNSRKYSDLITFVKDRPGHDKRYAININKISTELKWQPEESFETGIEKTIDWYLDQ